MDASFLNGSPAASSRPRRSRPVRARSGPRLHAGDLERDAPGSGRSLTERLALAWRTQRLVDAALGGPDRERGDRDAALVEDLQEAGVATAPLDRAGSPRARGRRRRTAGGCRRRSSRPCCTAGSTVNPAIRHGTRIAVISFLPPSRRCR